MCCLLPAKLWQRFFFSFNEIFICTFCSRLNCRTKSLWSDWVLALVGDAVDCTLYNFSQICGLWLWRNKNRSINAPLSLKCDRGTAILVLFCSLCPWYVISVIFLKTAQLIWVSIWSLLLVCQMHCWNVSLAVAGFYNIDVTCLVSHYEALSFMLLSYASVMMQFLFFLWSAKCNESNAWWSSMVLASNLNLRDDSSFFDNVVWNVVGVCTVNSNTSAAWKRKGPECFDL